MFRSKETTSGRSGRMEWASYGFLAGLVCGILMGWFFGGFIGAFFRVALVALIVVPVILLYLGWRKYVAPILRPPAEQRYVAGPPEAIETTAVVHGTAREPLPR